MDFDLCPAALILCAQPFLVIVLFVVGGCSNTCVAHTNFYRYGETHSGFFMGEIWFGDTHLIKVVVGRCLILWLYPLPDSFGYRQQWDIHWLALAKKEK